MKGTMSRPRGIMTKGASHRVRTKFSAAERAAKKSEVKRQAKEAKDETP